MPDKFELEKEPFQEAFGEVVESQISKVVVECWDFKKVPDFSTLVKIKCPWGEAIGCVVDIKAGFSQSGRQPFAYGLTFEELSIQQPQVLKLLKTWVSVSLFGYKLSDDQSSDFVFGIAQQLCLIHSFSVQVCDAQLIELSKKPMFFWNLFSSVGQEIDVDKIARSLVGRLSKLMKLDFKFFENFYDQYSSVGGVDNRRIRLLLKDFGSFSKN